MNAAKHVIDRAIRLSIIADLVHSYESDGERIELISALFDGGIISLASAESLIENFNLDAMK